MDTIISKLEEIGFINVRLIKSLKQKNKFEQRVVVENPSTYIYRKIFSCPVCDMTFENWALRTSKLGLNNTDLDLRPFYIPFDPLYYDVTICPYCGYGAIANYFYNILSSKQATIKEIVTPNFVYIEYPMIYTIDVAIERYLIALLSTLSKGAKSSERAYICLKLSWLNRDKKDFGQELLFQQYALSGFKAAHNEEDLPICGMDEPTLMYVMGELSRRLGDLDEAMRYISRVVSSRNISSRLYEKADTVKHLIKEGKEKERSFEPFIKIVKQILLDD